MGEEDDRGVWLVMVGIGVVVLVALALAPCSVVWLMEAS